MQNLKKNEKPTVPSKNWQEIFRILHSIDCGSNSVERCRGEESAALPMRHLRRILFFKKALKHLTLTGPNVKATLANSEYRFSETQGIRKDSDVKKQVHAGKGIYKMLQA